jgi:hypothetical protein
MEMMNMEEMNNIATQLVDEMRDIKPTESSKEIILKMNNDISDRNMILISNANRLKNPFRMIGIEVVMKDLNVCRNVAYKIFQRDDFPAINVGKSKQVMLLSYILWKLDRKD